MSNTPDSSSSDDARPPAGDRARASARVDPIAEAVRQWSDKELGSTAHMEATTTLRRVQQLVVSRIEMTLQPFDLTFAQYEALVLLEFSRTGKLPLGIMGERLMVHPASVTNTIDQLEKKGLAVRRAHASDRRRVIAHITRTGRSRVRRSNEALREIDYGLAEMSESEASGIAASLREFRARSGDID